MSLKEIVAKRIRAHRIAAGLSQESLAHLVGKNTTTISGIERSEFAPSIETIEKLSKTLKVPSAFFFPDDMPNRRSKKREGFLRDLSALANTLDDYDVETLLILARGLNEQNRSHKKK